MCFKSAAFRSGAIVLLSLIRCLLFLPLVCGGLCVWSLFCYALLSLLYGFAVFLAGKRGWLLYLVCLSGVL